MPTVSERRTRAAASRQLSVPEQLARLARRYAAGGDVRLAQLASWASDVYRLEELLWENGLAEAADPVAELAHLGEAIATAVEAAAAATTEALTPRGVVEVARRAMVETFHTSVRVALRKELSDLDHLDQDTLVPTAPSAADAAARRLGGRTPARLVEELRDAASDCVAVAGEMSRFGEASVGERLAHQAEVAAFEAYLVAAAVAAGDDNLASVDLRWELAGDLDRHALDTTRDPFATLRRKLISLVGSAEMETLWHAIESSEES